MLQKNTVLGIISRDKPQPTGETVRVSFLMDDDNMTQLDSYKTMMCAELEVTLGTGNNYVAIFALAGYCYPFMHTLTLNRHPSSFISRVVNGPLFARSLERLLRFDNFPSLRRIVVKSVCCVWFEW